MVCMVNHAMEDLQHREVFYGYFMYHGCEEMPGEEGNSAAVQIKNGYNS